MGFAIAETAAARGATVTAIIGSVTSPIPAGIRCIQVKTAEEMYRAVNENLPHATIFIGAAAVADFRPVSAENEKIKKGDRERYQLELVRNPDILLSASKNRRPGQLMIGFAAETKNVKEYAREKLKKKASI